MRRAVTCTWTGNTKHFSTRLSKNGSSSFFSLAICLLNTRALKGLWNLVLIKSQITNQNLVFFLLRGPNTLLESAYIKDWIRSTKQKSKGWIQATDTESASDFFRPDKVSKSLRAHFWGSKLLMITVRLSARHSAPAEPLPVVKVTNPRGKGGKRGSRDIDWELSTLWSTWGINDLKATHWNQELRIKAQRCWMFWGWNVQRQHNQKYCTNTKWKTAQTGYQLITASICAHSELKHREACCGLTFEWAAL